jgi:DNA-binding NtrC family response regulator
MQRRQPAAAGAAVPAAASGIATAVAPAAPEAEVQDTASAPNVPRVLLIDKDADSAEALSALLRPEAQVIHAATLAAAQQLLRRDIFALVVLDPTLPDGNAATLLPLIVATPVLIYAQREPAWPQPAAAFLPKPWTSQRRLWSTISRLLGVPTNMSAGD